LYIEKLQDHSIFYWLGNIFTATPFVTVRHGFPANDLVAPTVAITKDTIEVFQLELGNRTKTQVRTWIIDVFGVNEGQRDDYAYLVFNTLDNPITVYNYDEGFPPAVSPS